MTGETIAPIEVGYCFLLRSLKICAPCFPRVQLAFQDRRQHNSHVSLRLFRLICISPYISPINLGCPKKQIICVDDCTDILKRCQTRYRAGLTALSTDSYFQANGLR